ncbi:tRNA preQ1(34) S-adenosylmethionine ribosyltransferase-isomerase QueA [Meiothermus taiwanensis]|jgi:S-adenosylmethionine:tRNA ribosyltransferase-isomerase|uniref:S-adenosylmethionine:tRNA ribosyltransferase-isomerase n=2 Tax=Meiothermus taiwanensis TaxID=172827 RepID=A0A399EB07_9DEIN|nr:tRNA preQ1(34) S-adenosylmethionine ribosyltransferase-isomerase QueA [Meiothermus taiwanensis]AWR87624.1 S-adenosylmethionine/tRNA-ribosyltransferase- isomerase [Meiothermus taiwanensis WR-220]KIQ55099.1 S-adenosylmethionine tRNA ribosyltransferase [Meiothermus taiwanensis]KZK16722.1 tRNA preQ1(34) S-adenosylmethionine ribosyltransferase-isomerase QueA [Meiothermus taiwanensis]RIH79272.1 S-adenosylmethionine:tRNA ribosyltransferase-isomerase [Meiothermus taiwanensis]
MNLEDFDYPLPPELIAQSGAEPRDTSRLMVIERSSGQMAHRIFRDLPQYLRAGDVLVLNQSKVIPARTFATNPHGTALEVLLVREIPSSPGLWEALLKPAKRAKVGSRLTFPDGLFATVEAIEADGTRLLRFSGNVWEHLENIGKMPLPPYIHASVDPARYQTVYAKTPGSVAAPTAGLHFTPELLDRVRGLGVDIHYVTLHVGPGTFKPVHDDPDRHVMHLEPYEVSPQTAEAINRAKAEGRRVIAVGTTVVRTLETAYSAELSGVRAGSGETQLFIRPGFRFNVIDALITNFHLPKSTLLMLVSAFMGHGLMKQAYQTAVAERYRFYSLGDAMLIL